MIILCGIKITQNPRANEICSCLCTSVRNNTSSFAHQHSSVLYYAPYPVVDVRPRFQLARLTKQCVHTVENNNSDYTVTDLLNTYCTSTKKSTYIAICDEMFCYITHITIEIDLKTLHYFIRCDPRPIGTRATNTCYGLVCIYAYNMCTHKT